MDEPCVLHVVYIAGKTVGPQPCGVVSWYLLMPACFFFLWEICEQLVSSAGSVVLDWSRGFTMRSETTAHLNAQCELVTGCGWCGI